jgi:hypothetical protein
MWEYWEQGVKLVTLNELNWLLLLTFSVVVLTSAYYSSRSNGVSNAFLGSYNIAGDLVTNVSGSKLSG